MTHSVIAICSLAGRKTVESIQATISVVLPGKM